MKKLLIAVLLFLGLCVPAMAGSWDTYFYAPWQVMSTGSSGATSTLVTLEATANTNIVISQIICNSDLATANLVIKSFPRGTASFTTASATTEMTLVFASAPVCTHIGTTGQDASPLFIGDVGRAVQVSLTGTTNEALFVIAKRGQMPLSKAARNQAKGF